MIVRRSIYIKFLALVIAAVSACAVGASAFAQAGGTFEFMGVEVRHHVQDYIAATDVNIRSKPQIKSKKIGKLKKHRKIHVVGKALDDWVAVREDGQDIGFVYAPVLIAVLDGVLKQPLDGVLAKAGRPECQYTITYQGKSEAEGQVFEIADYEVRWRCRYKNNTGEFVTPMFMTEGPYKKSKKPTYQITVDIVESDGDLDEVVSTTVFYDRNKGTISFDEVSEKRFNGKPDTLEMVADSLPSALRAGVAMSYQAWPDPLWEALLEY